MLFFACITVNGPQHLEDKVPKTPTITMLNKYYNEILCPRNKLFYFLCIDLCMHILIRAHKHIHSYTHTNPLMHTRAHIYVVYNI